MNRADLLKQIADAHYQLADLYLQLAGESASAPVSAAGSAAASPAAAPASSAPSFDELPPKDSPAYFDQLAQQPSLADESVEFAQGSLEQCPKHRKPYKAGRYGPFCTSTSDDPKWSNDKGYCTITPKSAAAWLRQQAAVTA